MTTRHYKTDLRCEACVATIKPELDRVAGPGAWAVDLSTPDKRLSAAADPGQVGAALNRAGYHLLGEVQTPAEAGEEKPATYYPLGLLVLFLLGGTALLQARAVAVDPMRAMADFMGLFFVAFAFFKLLDVPAFASAYAGYDEVARRWFGWGYVYPFVELTLGVLYLLHVWPVAVNAVTLAVTAVGAVGVARTLLGGRKIRCACLGSVFNLPMSYVSLAEDVGMALMAAAMLVVGA